MLVFEDEVSGIANGKVLISVEAGTVNFKELLITGNTLKEPDVKNVLVEIWLPCIYEYSLLISAVCCGTTNEFGVVWVSHRMSCCHISCPVCSVTFHSIIL